MATLPNTAPEVLWLSASPGFRRLERKFLCRLGRQVPVAHWAYEQSCDEPSSLEIALTLLHDHVKAQARPLHLVGHSIGGVLGLLYARKFPQRVRSLTLLAVGASPLTDWQSHYYTQLGLLPCSRDRILTQMVYALFGHHPKYPTSALVQMLEQDLLHSPSPHSLVRRVSLGPDEISAPVFICGGYNDAIVDPVQIQRWRPWLKPGDRIWQCPNGRHFFHTEQPQQVAQQILGFWQTLEDASPAPICIPAAS